MRVVLSTEATTVSFDGRQQLTVDLDPLYDHVISSTSEVDHVSLRFRTRYSSAHLLTSSSRHVTTDRLTIVISDGRLSVDIRTAADHKVRTTSTCAATATSIAVPSVCLSVCPSVTLVNRIKMAERIEFVFESEATVGGGLPCIVF